MCAKWGLFDRFGGLAGSEERGEGGLRSIRSSFGLDTTADRDSGDFVLMIASAQAGDPDERSLAMMPITSIPRTNPTTGSSLHLPRVKSASRADSMLRNLNHQLEHVYWHERAEGKPSEKEESAVPRIAGHIGDVQQVDKPEHH